MQGLFDQSSVHFWLLGNQSIIITHHSSISDDRYGVLQHYGRG